MKNITLKALLVFMLFIGIGINASAQHHAVKDKLTYLLYADGTAELEYIDRDVEGVVHVPSTLDYVEMDKSGNITYTWSGTVTKVRNLNVEKVTELIFPETISEVGTLAGKKLQHIQLPASVTKFDGIANLSCPSLNKVTCLAVTPPQMRYELCLWTKEYNENRPVPLLVIVPSESLTNYQQNRYWGNKRNGGNFVYSVAQNMDAVQNDGYHYLVDLDNKTANCFLAPNVENVTIPENIKCQGKNIPVTKLNEKLFWTGFSNLKNLDLPSSLKEIDKLALRFYDAPIESFVCRATVPPAFNGYGNGVSVRDYKKNCNSKMEVPLPIIYVPKESVANYKDNYSWESGAYVVAPIGSASSVLSDDGDKYVVDEEEDEAVLLDGSDKEVYNVKNEVELEGKKYTVRKLGAYCFANAEKLQKLIVPPTVSTFDNRCLRFCERLENVVLQNGTMYDGRTNSIFATIFRENAEKPKHIIVNVPSDILEQYRGSYWWKNDGFKKYNYYYAIGSNCSIDSIGTEKYLIDREAKEAFLLGMGSVSSVSIPSSVEVENATYPVTQIGKCCFTDNTNLTQVKIPESIDAIDYAAFSGCSKLESIDFPSTLNRLDPYALSGCSKLSRIVCRATTPPQNMDLYSAPSTLLSYISAEHQVVIPAKALWAYKNDELWKAEASNLATNTKEVVVSGSKYEIDLLTEEASPIDSKYSGRVTIPSKVTLDEKSYRISYVTENAFKDNLGITTLRLPKTVESLGTRALANCRNLKRVEFYETTLEKAKGSFRVQSEDATRDMLATLGNECFGGCSSLESLTLPSSLKYVGVKVFDGCNALKSLVCYAPIPPVTSVDENGNTSFTGAPIQSCVLSVDENSLGAYKADAEWAKWQQYSNTVTQINSIVEVPMSNSLYYNLNGMRTGKLQKGVSVVKAQDGKSYKILVR